MCKNSHKLWEFPYIRIEQQRYWLLLASSLSRGERAALLVDSLVVFEVKSHLTKQ